MNELSTCGTNLVIRLTSLNLPQNLEIYMNVRRELERLKFIPVLKVFIDPGCPDQARLKEIITKMGGLIASSAGTLDHCSRF